MARPKARTRIKKRIFVVAGIVLIVIALAAGLLSMLLASLIGPANLYRFQIGLKNNQSTILGSGLNLKQAVSANFVKDSSFEPLIFKNALTLYGGDENTLTVSSEEASAGLYGDGFFNGATARILTATENGLALKKSATVVQYGINRVGVFQPLILPTDVPGNRAVLDFTRKDLQSVAVGQGGLIIRNVAGQILLSGSSGVSADLTGVCTLVKGYLAVSSAGNVIHSQDGAVWLPWSADTAAAFTAIAASGQDLAVAVGMKGSILTGSNGYLNSVTSGTEHHLYSIAFGHDTFMTAGEDGTLLRSDNGLVWEPVLPAQNTDWQSVVYNDGRFLVVGSNGRIGLSDDGRTFSFMTVDSTLVYKDAAMLSGQQLILLDSQGRFYISNDSGKSWQRSGIDTGMISSRIEMIGKDKILSADNEGRLGQAQIVAEIELDSPLQNQTYKPGDLCFLEVMKKSIPDNYLGYGASLAKTFDPWQVQGNGTAQRTSDEAAPSGGSSAMRLNAGLTAPIDPLESTILTQLIDPQLILGKSRNQVYRIELFMRQEQVSNRSIMTWISGPFTSVGTEFTNVGGTYKKYTFTFVLPTESVTDHTDIRLNIAFQGSGTLLVDRVYFGPATDLNFGLEKTFAEAVLTVRPPIIRLAFAGLGSSSVASGAFARVIDNANPFLNEQGYQSGMVQSIHTALNLCISAKAEPYIVIGSYMSESDLQNLLEYLCGPISEPYGQMRMNNGKVEPFVDSFDRIIIEINDQDKLLRNDQQKAAYVNLLIRTIEQSPYYRQLKSKLVFADGMAYQDGVLLSRADYHASDFFAQLTDEPETAIDQSFLSYYDLIPRTPDRTEGQYTELMRSVNLKAKIGQSVRLSGLTNILLQDLGQYSSLSCLDLDLSTPSNIQIQTSAAQIAADAARGMPLSVTSLNEWNNVSADTSQIVTGSTQKRQPVQAFAFMENQRVAIVLINSGTSPAILQLSTDLPVTPGSIRKYDESGLLLSTQKLRNVNSRINLLPGGVAIILSDEIPVLKP